MSDSDLIEQLNLPAKTLEALRGTPLPSNADRLKELFFHDPAAFGALAAEMDELTILGMYLRWLPDARKKYDDRGIPAVYFRDSMKDIAIWCEDALEKHGVPGFREWAWVGRSLRLEVIRIGRLQFEPSRLARDAALPDGVLPAGTPVLEVHIPAGEPLDPEAVQDSLSRAPEFFRRYFGGTYSLFRCHSWLLCPALKELLPPQSRILEFQRLFTVYETDTQERQAEERVFGILSDDPGSYPESTSLQKALKQRLLSGGPISMGAGIRALL